MHFDLAIAHLIENWESIDFPMINKKQNSWSNRNATLSGLKLLFAQENLKAYEDYVITVNPEYKDNRFLTVRFKQEGQGLICLIRWMGSNYYKERA